MTGRKSGSGHMGRPKDGAKLSVGMLLLAWLSSADCGLGQSSNSLEVTVSGSGDVAFWTTEDNQITALTTTLVVPPKPAKFGTLFLWPGLQPGGANYLPIGNGVLQPVLTWGHSCAPGDQPAPYASWWISAQYVNTIGHYHGYTGCHGGPTITVSPGDTLLIKMFLSGAEWHQTIDNLQTGISTGYIIDLKGQAQTYAYFFIEKGKEGAPPVADVVFMDTKIAYLNADPLNCRLRRRGADDLVTKPIAFDGGQMCYIERITLKSGH